MKTPRKPWNALCGLLLSACMATSAYAANTHTIPDPQEIPFASGYDIREITFTLNADFSMTADIYPYGVPGDADGDGDPNASTTAGIIDGPGVGPTEQLRIGMECGATDVTNGCTSNVLIIYGNNTLTVVNLLNGNDLTPYVTFSVLLDRYVLTITDLNAFKATLGIPSTAVNFGAFSVAASFTDSQVDDQVPDNGACEAVHLDPPQVAQCDLLLSKTASVSTVGPLYSPISNDDDDDDAGGHDHTYHSDDSKCGHHDLYCGCKGKVSELTLRYLGITPTTVTVDRSGPFDTNLMPATAILPGDEFTVTGSNFGPKGFRGTLGVSIKISESDGDVVELHTSCSQPIGPGLVAGDFMVISGESKKLNVPLCEVAPIGCPLNQQVTYTYTVTNNGTDITGLVVTDDKMVDPVGGPIDLAQNASISFTADACLYETTTNIASATGTLSNAEACVSNEASVTVEMLLPPPPEGCTGDCDDDDSSSGGGDGHQGCGPDYWEDHKRHKHRWGKHRQDDRFDAVFGVDASGNKGLLKVLKDRDRHGRGGSSKDLQRQAAAAFLNASDPDVNYFYTPGEVVEIVVNAYKTRDFESAKNLLKAQNEKGCPHND